jgi:hypothetical protein
MLDDVMPDEKTAEAIGRRLSETVKIALRVSRVEQIPRGYFTAK